MTYNTNEAQHALDRLGAALSGDSKKQHEAAKRLLQEAAQLRKPAGIDRIEFTSSECLEISIRPGGFRRIWLAAPDLKFKICEADQVTTTRDLNAAVEYDPVGNRYVGTEDEPAVVPVPGGKRIRRDALAALIDAIGKDLLAHAR